MALPSETIAEHLGQFAEVYEETLAVFNPWRENEAQQMILDLVTSLGGMTLLDQQRLELEHKLIAIHERYVTPLLAMRLGPFTARALHKVEARLAGTETEAEEHALLTRLSALYSTRLALFTRIASGLIGCWA